MKTKAFYTAITTDNLEKTMEFYVVLLGFQVTHRIDTGENRIAVLENDAGAKIDVIEAKNAPGGCCAFRTNVNDIEEAAREFTARGYEVKGPMEISTGRALLVKDPNGLTINVIQHIHKEKK